MHKDILARIQTALTQEVRRHPEHTTAMTAAEAIAFLIRVVEHAEKDSYSRARLVHLGKHIMRYGLLIIAPACPDYTHENGVYTFRGVRGGTSLLAQLQIQFLQQLGIKDVTLVYADVERFDKAIRDKLCIDEDAFLELIHRSRTDSESRVPSSWKVVLMSDLMPTLYEDSEARMVRMLDDVTVRQRLVSETHQRSSMYQRLVPWATFDDMLLRTARTAAQYCELGAFAVREW